MAISTVNVDFSAILQNAAQATGLLRVRLSQVGTVEDSETGDTVILPIAWQETTLTDGAATLALVPNKLIEPSCTYYEIQLKSVPDCPKACAKLLLSGIMYVPDEDCNVLDLLISPPSPETANTASGYASQAKQAAQVAENFAIQAGDRYDDVAEAAATALTDIGTAKQDALDAIGTAQSGATEAISTAEDAALQAIGQARGTALDDIGTAQGTAIGAVQAEGNTQVGRVEDAGEDAVADVTAAQATAVSAVQAQQATSVAAVTAEGTAQVNAVTQAGNGYVATMQGLVSDAQAARDAAQTAQGLAEDAQAAAESASTDAQGYAGDASTSAGQAAQSASDAATSATAAQASADSIAASAEQIQTNERNISNIQALLNGTLYREETDSAEAYSKTVPAGAMPYATINEIGGRTVVWNQLVRNGDFSEGTTGWGKGGGVSSFSVANNVVTLVFATGQFYNHYIGKSGVSMTNGHKYYVTGTFQSSSITQAFIQTSRNTKLVNVTGTKPVGKISSIFNNSQDTGNTSIFFRFADATLSEEGTGTLSDCYLIDLTLMFGAGNEPSSVAEFEAMFPSIDPAYNAGELRSAGVTEVVSEGRNLLNPQSLLSTSTAGYSVDNAGVLRRSASTGDTSAWLYSNSLYHLSLPAGDYTVGVDVVETSTGTADGIVVMDSSNVDIYRNITSTLFDVVGNTIVYTFTLTQQTDIGIKVKLPANNAGAVRVFVNRGNSNAYIPFIPPIEYPIPSAIQSLPSYGWSTHYAYNGVDFVSKKYSQRVVKKILNGSSSDGVWSVAFDYVEGTRLHRMFRIGLPNLKISPNTEINYAVKNLLSDSYEVLFIGDKTEYNGWTIRQANGASSIYFSCPSNLQNTVTLDAFKAMLAANPVTLYYELATPIETDISSLLTDSTIEVEPGGSLTFKNQNGDNFRLPIPNSETFLVQATPELPSADGTYTLQCTVTDGTPSVTWVSA